MSVDANRAAKARQKVLATAGKGFRFRGTRKIMNRDHLFIDRSAEKGDAIPAGRKTRPYAELVRAASEDIYNEEDKYNNNTGALLARHFPDPAVKVVAGKDLKALELRRGLFVPLDISGLRGWLDRQKAYFEGLSIREKDIINSYTSHGDRLVNAYCRGSVGDVRDLVLAMSVNESVPLAHSFYDQFHLIQRKFPKDVIHKKDYYKYEDGILDMVKIGNFFASQISFFGNAANIATLLEQYKQDLLKIIDGAPRLTSDLVVYRGIQSEAHLTDSDYKNIDFLSTTLDPASVLPFTTTFEDKSGETRAKFHCCVYEMTLHKSVPCIYMQFISEFSDEFEVLVPPGMNISLGKEVQVKMKPPRREVSREELLEPYYNENVLVVEADVRRPPPRTKIAGKTVKSIFKKR